MDVKKLPFLFSVFILPRPRHLPSRGHNDDFVSDISLNGGEISLLKTLGLSGGTVAGRQLVERMDDMEGAEFLDTLGGLMTMGYVVSNKVNVRTMEAVESATFRVNPSFARDLKDAVYPSRKPSVKTGRRQRRA